MRDLLEKIDRYIAYAATDTSPVVVPAGCDLPWIMLSEAKTEILSLRALVGKAELGPTFSEITKDLPRRSGESD